MELSDEKKDIYKQYTNKEFIHNYKTSSRNICCVYEKTLKSYDSIVKIILSKKIIDHIKR